MKRSRLGGIAAVLFSHLIKNASSDTVTEQISADDPGGLPGISAVRTSAYHGGIYTAPRRRPGAGLSTNATAGAPDVLSYGDTQVYLRRDMNGWTTDDGFDCRGTGIYVGQCGAGEQLSV